jgi:signal transduction histidine kinase
MYSPANVIPVPADLDEVHTGLGPTIAPLDSALSRRWVEEQLAMYAGQLARKNEALEDFAALVAHDVRSSLLSALRSDDPREGLTRALELVDSILEAEQAGQRDSEFASVAECVQQAVADLGEVRAEVVTTVTGDVPIPPAALRIVLRNLLANAVAAGAHRVHVSALGGGDRRALVVDDDGVGLGSTDGYATGAGLGVALCRRLLSRFGGLLELKPRADGGTRAVILVAGADE